MLSASFRMPVLTLTELRLSYDALTRSSLTFGGQSLHHIERLPTGECAEDKDDWSSTYRFCRMRTNRSSMNSAASERAWDTTALLQLDPVRARVDIADVATHETQERHVGVARELDRQARRRRDRGDEGNARHDCLLDNLEGSAPAHEQHAIGERYPVQEQLPADHLVDRVVAADVFGAGHQPAVAVEHAGRVQPSGLVEGGLCRAQCRRHPGNHARRQGPGGL